LVEGVSEAGHEPGLDEFRVAALELGFFLDSEGGWLEAELVESVSTWLEVLDVGGAALDGWAGVCEAGALDLEVGKALKLIEGQGVGGLVGERGLG